MTDEQISKYININGADVADVICSHEIDDAVYSSVDDAEVRKRLDEIIRSHRDFITKMKKEIKTYLMDKNTPVSEIEDFLSYKVSADVLKNLEQHIDNVFLYQMSNEVIGYYYNEFCKRMNREVINICFELTDWAKGYPTGAFVTFEDEECESDYCETVEDFKHFINHYKEFLTTSTEVKINFESGDLPYGILAVINEILEYYNKVLYSKKNNRGY